MTIEETVIFVPLIKARLVPVASESMLVAIAKGSIAESLNEEDIASAFRFASRSILMPIRLSIINAAMGDSFTIKYLN